MSEKDICLNFKSLSLANEISGISVDPHITLAISIPIPHQLSTLIQNSDSSKTVYFNSWSQLVSTISSCQSPFDLFCPNTTKSHLLPEECPKKLPPSDPRHICTNVTRPDPTCFAIPNTNRYPPYSSFHLFVEDFESQQLVRLLVQPSDFPSTIIQLAHNIMNNNYRRDNEYLLLNGKILNEFPICMYGIGEGETLHLFSLAILRFLKALMTEAELIYPYNDLGRKYRRVSTPQITQQEFQTTTTTHSNECSGDNQHKRSNVEGSEYFRREDATRAHIPRSLSSSSRKRNRITHQQQHSNPRCLSAVRITEKQRDAPEFFAAEQKCLADQSLPSSLSKKGVKKEKMCVYFA